MPWQKPQTQSVNIVPVLRSAPDVAQLANPVLRAAANQSSVSCYFACVSLLFYFVFMKWKHHKIWHAFCCTGCGQFKKNLIKRHFLCEYICVCLNVGVIGVDISRTQYPFFLADFWNMTSLMPLSFSMHIYFWAQRYYICMVICVCHRSCVFLSYPPIHLLYTDSKLMLAAHEIPICHDNSGKKKSTRIVELIIEIANDPLNWTMTLTCFRYSYLNFHSQKYAWAEGQVCIIMYATVCICLQSLTSVVTVMNVCNMCACQRASISSVWEQASTWFIRESREFKKAEKRNSAIKEEGMKTGGAKMLKKYSDHIKIIGKKQRSWILCRVI